MKGEIILRPSGRDDTDRLQAALDTGKTVILRPGEYRVSVTIRLRAK